MQIIYSQTPVFQNQILRLYVINIQSKKYHQGQMFYCKICHHMKYKFMCALSIYLGFEFQICRHVLWAVFSWQRSFSELRPPSFLQKKLSYIDTYVCWCIILNINVPYHFALKIFSLKCPPFMHSTNQLKNKKKTNKTPPHTPISTLLFALC